MLDRVFTIVAGRIAALAGQPVAFIVAVLLILGWGLTGPVFGFSDTWQLIVNTSTTIVTFLMVFLIQNSQNRDAAALQAKLDELIRSMEGARNEFIGIEHRSDREIESIRAAIEGEVREDADAHSAATVDRLRNRY
ncbi:low affinity Fe/Cu permease [Sphingomonas sp. BE123]|jgi:low affinity Fe/Cu permease|uniref:low affinity iron permease family protein n=1 Tax=unclassified Sphingomonas TaxID=196159 RepID=UPI0028608FF9|nr:low affinity iron permease family protein [Sphingomonas sp. BE123]MDR6853542.1 low affinity Fe/Cu permease [Sphingomonas sp. BE123]